VAPTPFLEFEVETLANVRTRHGIRRGVWNNTSSRLCGKGLQLELRGSTPRIRYSTNRSFFPDTLALLKPLPISKINWEWFQALPCIQSFCPDFGMSLVNFGSCSTDFTHVLHTGMNWPSIRTSCVQNTAGFLKRATENNSQAGVRSLASTLILFGFNVLVFASFTQH
jgi:hypothetical protein